MHTLLYRQDLEHCGQVGFEEVIEYCQKINCPLVETSAKTGLNVTESFRLLLDRVAELEPSKFTDSRLFTPAEDSTSKQKKSRCVLC